MAAEFKKRHPKLHVLVDNAATFSATRKTTADGNVSMFGVNHLAPFLLPNLLLDVLKAGSEVSFDKIKTLSTPRPARAPWCGSWPRSWRGPAWW